MAGPTAASTPAKSQLKTSRIPVRQYSSQQEIRSTAHKVTQPFAASSKSIPSVSVGTSSPQLVSSIGGASGEHHNTSLHHPTGVTLTQKQQHPTVVMATQQHYPTGVTMTQWHHPVGVMTTQPGVMTTQHRPTGIAMTQLQNHFPEMMTTHHHPTGVMNTHQHRPTAAVVTQTNNVGHINSTKFSHDATPADNSFDISSGNKRAHVIHMLYASMLGNVILYA